MCERNGSFPEFEWSESSLSCNLDPLCREMVWFQQELSICWSHTYDMLQVTEFVTTLIFHGDYCYVHCVIMSKKHLCMGCRSFWSDILYYELLSTVMNTQLQDGWAYGYGAWLRNSVQSRWGYISSSSFFCVSYSLSYSLNFIINKF